jgi:16S rRNA A1518/A1519 N6-dimethyltransferase RsmA/KsgA/DIM1 with predicted DNA glycosylase/AP lyase activity
VPKPNVDSMVVNLTPLNETLPVNQSVLELVLRQAKTKTC